MTDMPTAKPFRPEAEVESPLSPSAESGNVQQRIAVVLLQHAVMDTTGRPRLSQRKMAEMLGASWDTVNRSVKSLQAEGAIKIDRHRMIINKKALERIAMAV